jgi:hypothetical protein
MDSDALHKLQDAVTIVRALENKLHSLAHAFDAVGNDKVADRLCRYAADAGHAWKMVEEGTNEALSRALTASEQATANMLLAAIGGRSAA